MASSQGERSRSEVVTAGRSRARGPDSRMAPGRSPVLVGWVLVGFGLLLLLDRFVPVFSWRFLGPVALVVLGTLLVVRGRHSR